MHLASLNRLVDLMKKLSKCRKKIILRKEKSETEKERDVDFYYLAKKKTRQEWEYSVMPLHTHKPKNNCLQSIDFFTGNC